MQHTLVIENLSVEFKQQATSFKALNNINLHLKAGEIMAVVGESGSGKSVTALSILQLLPPKQTNYHGKILFQHNSKHIDLLNTTTQQIEELRGKAISMIFQEPMTSLNPVLTCGVQVAEVLQKHENISFSEAKEQTIALFQKVQIPEPTLAFNKYPHQLSGGQKQRVMIAMAMACKPALLICDEPTTALDVTVQKNILQLIKNLQQETNMAVLFITHDLSVVSEIADTIAVMYKGAIVEYGSTESILKNATHAYTKALIACRPALYSKEQRLPVVEDFLKATQPLKIEVSTPLVQVATAKKQPLVSINHLTVTYTKNQSFFSTHKRIFTAVNNVSFSINKGETVGLVGESGCGKTTLGRCILQLMKPNKGSILYEGVDLTQLTAPQLIPYKRKMQLIFQDPYGSLNPKLTIGKTLTEPMLFHKLVHNPKAATEKAVYLLNKVGLDGNALQKYPHQFSGGQRQRIVIARALAVEPNFIVCDESVSALDVSMQSQILNLLNDLKVAFNLTLLFISHDLSVVKYLSDYMLVMQQGQIVEQGVPEQIFNNPTHIYTQKLIEAMPVFSL